MFMPAADTIRILVATDNHVGYAERDPRRGNDSMQTFEEIMQMAKDQDVDMVLLAGDLFHENKPSRKAMYEVIKSIRMNCFGDKPCELQMLSDASEVFQGTFNHANYEDEDLNVAIPVFSIHGNHYDPSGEGHFAALDLLQVSGLVNYYGRVPESDNITVKPVLLQKGRTKLALYGLSNVRDERLFRTFRDGKVKFYQPGTQKSDWFNLMSVHQNHHAYTDTGYLPENFLPKFMDLVVWGHEHECIIDPSLNPEMGFHVMQPGSSVATSLSVGEAVPKHVAILSIAGKEFKCESIRLKTVRPFVMREIVLNEFENMRAISKKSENRTQVTNFLTSIVEEMIVEAKEAWAELQDDLPEDASKYPKPLIRLRVEYSAPEGCKYDCENPQRFSNRFNDKVANTSDVVQFHRKKKAASIRAGAVKPTMPDEEALANLEFDAVKIDDLVKEYLTAQSLTILPQNSFGDAVFQYVEKNDTNAVDTFVTDTLTAQSKHLVGAREVEDGDDAMVEIFQQNRERMEQEFETTNAKRRFRARKPDDWDTDEDGKWQGNDTRESNGSGKKKGGSRDVEDDEELLEDEDDDGNTRARRAKATTKAKPRTKTATTTKKAAAKKPAAKKSTKGKGRRSVEDKDDDDDDDDDNDVHDVIMNDDDDDEEDNDAFDTMNGDNDEEIAEDEPESQGLFVSAKATAPTGRGAKKAPAKRAASPKRKAPARAPAAKSTVKATSAKQSTISFSQASQTPAKTARAPPVRKILHEIVGNHIHYFTSITNNTFCRAMMPYPMRMMRLSLSLQQPKVDDEFTDENSIESCIIYPISMKY